MLRTYSAAHISERCASCIVMNWCATQSYCIRTCNWVGLEPQRDLKSCVLEKRLNLVCIYIPLVKNKDSPANSPEHTSTDKAHLLELPRLTTWPKSSFAIYRRMQQTSASSMLPWSSSMREDGGTPMHGRDVSTLNLVANHLRNSHSGFLSKSSNSTLEGLFEQWSIIARRLLPHYQDRGPLLAKTKMEEDTGDPIGLATMYTALEVSKI